MEEETIPLLSEEEMNKIGAKLVKAEIMGNTVRSFCLYHKLYNLIGTLKYENAVQYNCSVFKHILIGFPCLIHSIFYIFQAMIEKLKSQLEAAHKAKENHAVQMKLREMAKSKQVCNYLSYFVNVKLILK